MVRISLVMLLVSACATVRRPDADFDKDGVPDSRDACADVPGEPPDGCPAPDRDADGLLDPREACPDGCPSDTDGDNVPDAQDRCPQQPETRNGYLEEDGCPDEIPIQFAKYFGKFASVAFAPGKRAIRAEVRPKLDHVVTVMNEFPGIRVMISGHTDAKEKSPAELSLRRAEAARAYVIEKGVAAERLEVRGAGADEPIDTNKNATGRARNRRVEFTVLDP